MKFLIFNFSNSQKWDSAETADSEFIFLDTKVYKSENFNRESTPDIQMYYEEEEIFEYLNFHPSSRRKRFRERKSTMPPWKRILMLYV